LFYSMQAAGVVGKRGDEVSLAIQRASEKGAGLDDRGRLAYDLYSASFFQPAVDARFMMLAMALETTIEQNDRSEEVQEEIDALIAAAKDSSLEPRSAASLIGGLKDLKRESVGEAGRRVAAMLGERIYLDRPAVKFFTYCYALRSQLAHGGYPRPSRNEVDLAAAQLERFVGDLLGIALLDDFPH
jgi:hypothetical protein